MEYLRTELIFHEHRLARYRFASSAERSPILFFHGTGYSALTYQTLFERWADAGHEVYALDFLAHGSSSKSDDFSDWFSFRDQAIALIDAVCAETEQRPFLVGHSLGGASSLLAAALRPDVRAVAALDPVVLGPLLVQLMRFMDPPLAKKAQERRSEFKNLEVVARSYRRSPAFRGWDDRVFGHYLDSCFVQREGGGFQLALPPAIEAKVFRGIGPGHWPEYRKLKVPLFVYTPHQSDVCPAPSARRLTRVQRSLWKTHETGSHFFPMEDPDHTAAEVLRFFHSL